MALGAWGLFLCFIGWIWGFAFNLSISKVPMFFGIALLEFAGFWAVAGFFLAVIMGEKRENGEWVKTG